MNKANISELVGKTLTVCEESSLPYYDYIVRFTTTDGVSYALYHEQDCCESVTLEDICGDLNDLVGSPILVAEEVSNEEGAKSDDESYTWTFYKFSTIKGSVTLRWYGTSNGYYSERVDFARIGGIDE